jgi:hypothetical protein
LALKLIGRRTSLSSAMESAMLNELNSSTMTTNCGAQASLPKSLGLRKIKQAKANNLLSCPSI